MLFFSLVYFVVGILRIGGGARYLHMLRELLRRSLDAFPFPIVIGVAHVVIGHFEVFVCGGKDVEVAGGYRLLPRADGGVCI